MIVCIRDTLLHKWRLIRVCTSIGSHNNVPTKRLILTIKYLVVWYACIVFSNITHPHSRTSTCGRTLKQAPLLKSWCLDGVIRLVCSKCFFLHFCVSSWDVCMALSIRYHIFSCVVSNRGLLLVHYNIYQIEYNCEFDTGSCWNGMRLQRNEEWEFMSVTHTTQMYWIYWCLMAIHCCLKLWD